MLSFYHNFPLLCRHYLAETVFEDIKLELREDVVEYFKASVKPEIRAALGRHWEKDLFFARFGHLTLMTRRKNWFQNFLPVIFMESIWMKRAF